MNIVEFCILMIILLFVFGAILWLVVPDDIS